MGLVFGAKPASQTPSAAIILLLKARIFHAIPSLIRYIVGIVNKYMHPLQNFQNKLVLSALGTVFIYKKNIYKHVIGFMK
jgi:hypothetical protein